MRINVIIAFVFLVLSPLNSTAQTIEQNALAISEAAIGKKIPNLSFKDSFGKEIDLASLRGKPLLISLIYTGCTDVCPTIIENMYPAIEIAQEALGSDSFTILTVGFDAKNDTPGRMRSYARSHGVDLPNWLFLSTDKKTIQKLVTAIGFSIIPSAGGFDHSAQISIVDAESRIYQQIRGGVFSPPAIVEPLKDLFFKRRRTILSIDGIAERIKLFCTVYNPNTGRYYFNYSLFIGMAIGIASLLLVFIWLIREFRLSGRPDPDIRP